jgi:hypothetical protein
LDVAVVLRYRKAVTDGHHTLLAAVEEQWRSSRGAVEEQWRSTTPEPVTT